VTRHSRRTSVIIGRSRPPFPDRASTNSYGTFHWHEVTGIELHPELYRHHDDCHSTIRRFFTVSEDIIYVTDDTFETEVLNAADPVLVDYWAEWCGPCKMIAPILDEIAAEYNGKIRVAKLNIDDNPQTPPKYGIRGIPTLMLFKDGNVEATKVGAVSKSQLTAFIDSNI
jgi:thioredoxin 1